MYGGSVENRSRFGLDVIRAVVNEIGEERVAIRLSPWGTAQDMGMNDPIPQFTHFVSTIKQLYPNFAYIHVVESETSSLTESNDFLRKIWAPKPYISTGGYTRDSAIRRVEETGDLVAFGRLSPDLVDRLEHNLPLAPYDRTTFYVPAEDPKAAVGYIDYPFASSKDRDVARNVVRGRESRL